MVPASHGEVWRVVGARPGRQDCGGEGRTHVVARLDGGAGGGDYKLKCRFGVAIKETTQIGGYFPMLRNLNHHRSTRTELLLRRCDEMGALEIG